MIKAAKSNLAPEHKRGAKAIRLHGVHWVRKLQKAGRGGGGKNSSRLERNISLINAHISPRGDFMKH